MTEDISDHDLLIRIDEKVTLACMHYDKGIKDHEIRIREIEVNQNKFMGAVVLLGASMGVLGAKINSFLWGA